MKPQVSVIIPNYNHARYLRERIESVLRQDYDDYEVIILDDASTDGSRDIIREYEGHPRVSHVVANEQNSGTPFLQWDKGISLAQGEFVWIAESDDVADTQLLSTVVRELAKRSDAVVGFVHSRLIDEDGRLMQRVWHKTNSDSVLTYDGRTFVMQKMLTSNYIYNASMAVFRKSAYAAVSRHYKDYNFCGDWAFWMDIALKGSVVEVCRVLNSYRLHSRQTTEQSLKYGGKWLETGEILKTAADMLGLSSMQRKCLRGRYTKHFRHIDIPNRSEVLKVHGDIFGGSWIDICSYETGKLFHFLR